MTQSGLILSGGGARGAYEVGVLSYIFGDLARQEKRSPHFDIISGTSVGAVNGAFIAASLQDSIQAAARLEGVWSELRLATVMHFGFRQATSLHRVLLGGDTPAGIFDATPLSELVGGGISWRDLARNLRTGRLKALTVSATHVATGRPVVFLDRAPDVADLDLGDGPTQVQSTHILPHHVLASAALPLIFAPVPVRGELYCDGGLRLNTPMAPAIHLGAEKLLVIGVSSEIRKNTTSHGLSAGRMPGAPFLLGKVLNAFLLDHLQNDLSAVQWTNELLSDVREVGGPEMLKRLNEIAASRGAPPRRMIQVVKVRPSVDIGAVAGQYLRQNRFRIHKTLGRTFLSLLDVGAGADADLASYLLFDGAFARQLIDLGRRDAAAKREELRDFLYGPN